MKDPGTWKLGTISGWYQVPLTAKEGIWICWQKLSNKSRDLTCLNFRSFPKCLRRRLKLLKMPMKLSSRESSRPSPVFLVDQLYVQESSWYGILCYFGKILNGLCMSQIIQLFFCPSLCVSRLVITLEKPVQFLHCIWLATSFLGLAFLHNSASWYLFHLPLPF